MKRRRILALLLSLAMVLTYMPGLAYALEGELPDTNAPVSADDQDVTETPQAENADTPDADNSVSEENAVPSGEGGQAAETAPEAENAAPAQEDPEDSGSAEIQDNAAASENGAEAEDSDIKKKAMPSKAPKTTVNPDVETGDEDELLLQYVDEKVAEELNAASGKAYSKSRQTNLSGYELKLYKKLLALISKVASGEETSTEFKVPVADIFGEEDATQRLTADDLYVEELTTQVTDEQGNPVWVPSDEAVEAFYEYYDVDFDKVIGALLTDCPYELYWYDKTETGGFTALPANIIPVFEEDDEYLTFYDPDGNGPVYTFEFFVSGDYSANATFAAPGDLKTTTTNPDLTSAAADAAGNISSIITGNSAKSDLEKLVAYKDEICELTDYNDDAAEDHTTLYGNPWQLIFVFDRNEATKVVCEGYSKAFQYLFDNSIFNKRSIDCYTVTGQMGGGTGAGPHMWNILHMDDGKNYIADITNCDAGSAGYPDKLFLTGYSSGSMSNGYAYDCSGSKIISYEYSPETLDQYAAAQLMMSAAPYGGQQPEPQTEEGYDFVKDMTVIAGKDIYIPKYKDVTYENNEGEVVKGKYEITDLEVISEESENGSNVIDDPEYDDESSEWYIGTRGCGKAAVQVTYKKIGGTSSSYTFNIVVTDETFDVEMYAIDPEDPEGDETDIRTVFPGGEFYVNAYGERYYNYKDEGYLDYGSEMIEDPDAYVWSLEGPAAEYASIVKDEKGYKAVITVTDSDELAALLEANNGSLDLDVKVDLVTGNTLLASDTMELKVSNEYYSIEPGRWDLPMLFMFLPETVGFKLMRYSNGSDPEVVEDAVFTTDMDPETEEALSVETGEQENGITPLTFTRLEHGYHEFSVHAKVGGTECAERLYEAEDFEGELGFEYLSENTLYNDGAADLKLYIPGSLSNKMESYRLVVEAGDCSSDNENSGVSFEFMTEDDEDDEGEYEYGPPLKAKVHIAKEVLEDAGDSIQVTAKLVPKSEAYNDRSAYSAVSTYNVSAPYKDYYGLPAEELDVLANQSPIPINKSGSVFIRDANGESNRNYTVTSIEVNDGGEDFVEIRNNGDCWEIAPTEAGDATITISGYLDDDTNDTFTYESIWHVKNDIYSVEIEEGTYRESYVPEAIALLEAVHVHQSISEITDDQFGYEWSISGGNQFAEFVDEDGEVVTDPTGENVRVRFKVPENDVEFYGGTVTVKVVMKNGGEEVASCLKEFSIVNSSTEVELEGFTQDIPVGETVTFPIIVKQYNAEHPNGQELDPAETQISYRIVNNDPDAADISIVDGNKVQITRNSRSWFGFFIVVSSNDFYRDRWYSVDSISDPQATFSSLYFDGSKNGEGEGEEWAHFYSVDGWNDTISLADMNIEVRDSAGNTVDPDDYDVVVNHSLEGDNTEEVSGPYGLAEEDKNTESGFTEYTMTAVAKDGSSYESGTEISGTFCIMDKHSLNFMCSDVSYEGAAWSGDWRMHRHFKFEGTPGGLSLRLTSVPEEEAELVLGEDFNVTYYHRGPESDNWDEMFVANDDTRVDGIPSEPGEYFARIEGVDPYYGGNDVLIDIGGMFLSSDGSPNLWSDRTKEYTVTTSYEGDVQFAIGVHGESENWSDPANWDIVLDNDDEALEDGEAYYSYDADDKVLTLYGDTIYRKIGQKGLDIVAFIEQGDGDAVFAHAYVDIREARTEYELQEDREMLPGWDDGIDNRGRAYVENEEHPWGEDYDYDVESVEITKGVELIDQHETDIDEVADDDDVTRYYLVDNGDDFWFRIIGWEDWQEADPQDPEIVFTIRYRDVNGEEQTYDYKVTVVPEIFEVHLDNPENRFRGLPGHSFDVNANAWHKYFTEDGEYREDAEDLTYKWSYVIGSERADADQEGDPQDEEWQPVSGLESDFADFTVSDDGTAGHLEFKALTGSQHSDEFYVKVELIDPEDAAIRASDRMTFWCEDHYTEIWPTTLGDLDVGDKIENQEFEVREYSADNPQGKVVEADDLTFTWNDVDPEAIRITDMNDPTDDGFAEVENGKPAMGNVFSFERLKDWNIDFRVEARWTESDADDPDKTWECREETRYWLRGKDYDIRYDDHDREIYTDIYDYNAAHEEEDDFEPADPSNRLNIGDLLGADWEDKYDLSIEVGHADRNGDWIEGGMLKKEGTILPAIFPGDYTVETDDEGNVHVALTDTFLKKVEDYDDIRMDANLYLKGGNHEDEDPLGSTDAWFHVKEARADYENMSIDEDILPDRGDDICRWNNVRVKNTEFSGGEDFEYEVTGVEITDGWEYLNDDDVYHDENSNKYFLVRNEDENYDPSADDEGRGRDAWWRYQVRSSREIAEIREELHDDTPDVSFKVTYKDYNYKAGDEEKNYEFTRRIVNERCFTWIDLNGGSDRGGPGAVFSMVGVAWMEFINDEGRQDGTDQGFTFDFEITEGAEFADLTHEEGSPLATLQFNDVEIPDYGLDEEIIVKITAFRDDGSGNPVEVASEEHTFRLTDYHTEMFISFDGGENWVTNVNPEIMPGESADIKFQLRQYNNNLEAEYEEDAYGRYFVVDDPVYNWDFNENDVEIYAVGTDDGGERTEYKLAPYEEISGTDTFRFARLSGSDGEFRIFAEFDGDDFNYGMRFDNVDTYIGNYRIELDNDVLVNEHWRIVIEEGTSIEEPKFTVECNGKNLPEEAYTLQIVERTGFDDEINQPIYGDEVTGALAHGKAYSVRVILKEGWDEFYDGEAEPYDFELYSEKSVEAYHTTFVDNETEEQITHVMEDDENTLFEDWYFFSHADSSKPMLYLESENNVLSEEHYKARYNKQVYVEASDDAPAHYEPVDPDAWTEAFPSDEGVYLCEIDGVDPYYGTSSWIDLIKVEGHDWDEGQPVAGKEGYLLFTCHKCHMTKEEAIDGVADVVEAINALPDADDVTLEDEDDITAAREAFDALSDAQKTQISDETLSKLTAAEEKLADLKAGAENQAAAAAVTAAINNLPAADNVTVADKEMIEAARAAYDDLTEEQRALIDPATVARLAAAEAALAAAEAAAEDQAAANAVTESINNLPDADDVTVSDKAAITAARAGFNALTDEQKALVDSDVLAKLEAAEAALAAAEAAASDQELADAVTETLNALPDANAVTLADKTLIEEARAAYEALNDEQKALVSTEAKQKLTDAVTALAAAEAAQQAADQAAAAAVALSIDALPAADEITVDDKADIIAARAAYNALTDAQKALVSADALQKLTDAEEALAEAEAAQQLADQAAADEVADTIAELPEADNVTLANKEAIEAARAAYDALTAAQKELVNQEVVDKLEAAEAALTTAQQAADQTAADTVAASINALPTADAVTVSDKAAIEAARAAYDALTDAQKALVSEEALQKLKDAEAALEAAQQHAADQAAADDVADTIADLPAANAVTVDDKAAIEAARAAYDALTDAQKALVDSAAVDKLEAAEAALEAAQQHAADQAAADGASDKISALPAADAVTVNDKVAIEAARAAYDALTDAQKALVDSAAVDKLEAAEAALAAAQQHAADQAAADGASDKISALPAADAVTVNDKAAIEAARAAYDALTDAQKALVDSAAVDKLEAAEAALATAEAEQAMNDKVAAAETAADTAAEKAAAAQKAVDAMNDAADAAKEAAEKAAKTNDAQDIADAQSKADAAEKAQKAAADAIAEAEAAKTAADNAITAANTAISNAAASGVDTGDATAAVNGAKTKSDNAGSSINSAKADKSDADTKVSDARSLTNSVALSKAAADRAAAAKAAAEKAEADRKAAEFAANGYGYIDPKLPKVKIQKPKAAKKSFTAKWKKIKNKKQLKQIKGIEIEYSLTSDFQDPKFKTASKKKANVKIKKLKSKKTYYVRAHTYVIRNGVKYVSYWSAQKKVKVK